MGGKDEDRDAPARRHPAGAVTRAWGFMVDAMAGFGTLLILVLMTIVCSDIVARNLFNASLPLVAELGALTLVMIVYLQLGAAVRHNRLPRADFIIVAVQERSPLTAAILNASYQLVGAAMLAIIAWSTIGILEADMARGRYIGVTGVLTLPTWPFRLVILFGVAVASVQFLFQAAAAFRPEDDESEDTP